MSKPESKLLPQQVEEGNAGASSSSSKKRTTDTENKSDRPEGTPKKGRPKGSKDKKERIRRTKAQLEALRKDPTNMASICQGMELGDDE